VLPEIGAAKLQELRRQDIQRLADDLARREISAATCATRCFRCEPCAAGRSRGATSN